MSDPFDTAEAHRRIANLVRYGVVSELNAAAGTARIRFDPEWVSDFLPWLEPRAGAVSSWTPPSVGEQVIVLSASGEPGVGVILRGLSSTAHPPAATDPQLTRTLWPDGGRDDYDAGAHVRTIVAPAGGKLVLQIGGTEVLVEDGKVTLTAAEVLLGGPGAARKVARVGDTVSLTTGLILTGSDQVKAA